MLTSLFLVDYSPLILSEKRKVDEIAVVQSIDSPSYSPFSSNESGDPIEITFDETLSTTYGTCIAVSSYCGAILYICI